MIPTYLLARAIRPHAKVALGGDGGDELFAGYPHYRWVERGSPLVGCWRGRRRGGYLRARRAEIV